MWLLIALAHAADPPPAASLRRTCESGQLCDGRCIPWTEPCAASVKESLAAMEKDAKQASLTSVVCGPAPAPPAPPAPTVDQQILLSAAAGVLCGAESATDPDACQPTRADRDLPPVVPTPAAPVCAPAAPVVPPQQAAAPPRR